MVSRRKFIGGLVGAAVATAGCVTPSDSVQIVESSVSLSDAAPSEPEIVSQSERDLGRKRLVVEGTVTGRNGCYDDVVGSVSVEDGGVSAEVKPVASDGSQVCTLALVPLSYRIEMTYTGSFDELVVRHGGVDGGSYTLSVGGE